ncbi:MAG: RNA 2',3'-cyclic phosphodiesterase [Candidatus Marinimicrobia bacterium]|nr:RNA 2',3'-cyclic phosphodiesterase [Candidatus Neomarinimicrobiota bacterium]
MRIFLALELPEEIKKEIEKLQKKLRKAGAKAIWVKPEIVHLTLTFLGSVTHNQLEIIHKILDEIRLRPLRLELGSLGCFPNPERARIIFIDLQGDLKELHYLANLIRQNLKKEAIQFDDKPFVAHVTLGRIKKRQNLSHVLKGVKPKRIEFLAREITLNQSELSSSGPQYTKLKTIHLT